MPPTQSNRLTRAELDELADSIALYAARLDAATHELITRIRRFDAAAGWAVQGAKSCAHWLSWRIGIGLVAAREKVRVARALVELPRIDDAFARGELSYAKVRAMTRVADANNEDLLVTMARSATGAELERVCGAFGKARAGKRLDPDQRYVRRRFVQDNLVRIEMQLLPDEAERVWSALRETRLALAGDSPSAAVAGDSAESSMRPASPDDSAESSRPTLADAAVAMAESQLARLEATQPAVRAAAQRRQLFVHLREDRLGDASSWTATLQDGTSVAGTTLLRLACDSGLSVAKADAAGTVVDLGRRRRTISPPLLRALLARDRRCRFPGCTQRVFVEGHHLEHWAHGGATSLENLLLLCHPHHVAVHEGGCRVELLRDGDVAFFDADGRRIEDAPRPPSAAGGAAQIAVDQVAAGLVITAQTSLPRHDGALDLHAAVGALAARA